MKKAFFSFALLCCILLLTQSAKAWYKVGLADRRLMPNGGIQVTCYSVQDVCALSLTFEPPKSGDLVLVNFGAGNWEVIVVKSARYEGGMPVFEQGGTGEATAAEIQRGEALRTELGFN